MGKVGALCFFAAITAVISVPAAAENFLLDFDNGVDENNAPIVFDSNTIFSDKDDRYGDRSDNWQRYDGRSDGNFNPGNPADGGIPGTNVNVSIDVWNGRGRSGYAVGFDSSLRSTRDRDLEDPFTPIQSGVDPDGYRNILIIQSFENRDTKNCGGGRTGSGVCEDGNGNSFADDEAYGGDIVFYFDEEVTLFSMNIFDMEEDHPAAKVKFYDDLGELLEVVEIPDTPDNGVGLLTFNGDNGVSNVRKMLVWLPGSGAIDNIAGHDGNISTNIPEPGSMAIFAVGLVMFGFYRRRRLVELRA